MGAAKVVAQTVRAEVGLHKLLFLLRGQKAVVVGRGLGERTAEADDLLIAHFVINIHDVLFHAGIHIADVQNYFLVIDTLGGYGLDQFHRLAPFSAVIFSYLPSFVNC